MGLSLTNTHIHNKANLTKPQFKKALTDMMKAKGYTKATEDDASVSLSLVFSKDRKWVTVLGEDINTSDLTKSLGLQVLSVELVDSDFAELKLHSADSADTLMLGRPYMDEYPDQNPEKWQSILGENTWSQVEEIQSGDHKFAEDALAEFAQLIGLGENILLENDDIPQGAEILHFKKAKEKKLTLNAAFKQVFGPELEKQGFKPIKGSKKPIYLRVMTDEIINVISVENATARSTARRIGEYAFEINGDVLSIYDSWWGQHFPYGGNMVNAWIYRNNTCRNTEDKTDFDLVIKNMDKLQDFIYIKEDPESLIKSMEYSLQVTKDYLLKEMNSVKDINDCIRYYKVFGAINIRAAFNEFGDADSGIDESGHSSLMMIKADYRDDDMWNLIGEYEDYKKHFRGPVDDRVRAACKKKYDELERCRIDANKLRDKIFNTPELYEQAIAIADRVKEENIEILRKHGIEM
ncbi:MAG: hypothetical protein J6M17_06300 [Ruminococcus sp.]|nr:hypothetical protein [Ruminococcus sp.]